MPARSNNSSPSWEAGAVPGTVLPTLTLRATCFPASLPRNLRSVSAMSVRRNSQVYGTMQEIRFLQRFENVRSSLKEHAVPAQSENSVGGDAGCVPGHRTVRCHQKIRSARSGHRNLQLMAVVLDETWRMNPLKSRSALRIDCRESPDDIALPEGYMQVKTPGVRLEERVARIEWEPFIYLLTAGIWISR